MINQQIHESTLILIEKALDIKLHDWQRNYLLNKPMLLDMRITGRTTGKTLAYILKLLLESDEPLDLTNERRILNHSDWWCCENRVDRALGSHYLRWYMDYLKEIYDKLNKFGIKTRKVIFTKDNKHEHLEYKNKCVSNLPEFKFK